MEIMLKSTKSCGGDHTFGQTSIPFEEFVYFEHALKRGHGSLGKRLSF
jgi:hypothetical protein